MFYNSLVNLVYSVTQVFYIYNWILCLLVLSMTERGVEVSNYHCVFLYFSFQFYSVSFMYFETVVLSAYTSSIVISSWWINPFIIM